MSIGPTPTLPPGRRRTPAQACVQFLRKDDPDVVLAAIHLRWDGMPDTQYGLMPSFTRYFTHLQDQQVAATFSDPGQLAAGYVAFATFLRAGDPSRPLVDAGIAIVQEVPEGVQFRYRVLCDAAGKPEITVEEVVSPA